jgi:hypothetical protein
MRAPLSSRRSGFTLLEAIVACAVFSLAAATVAGGLSLLGDGIANARQEEQIVRTLRTLLEEQRFLRPLREGEQSLESPFPGVAFSVSVQPFEAETRDLQPVTGVWRVAVAARWKEGTQNRERFAEALCTDAVPDY